MLGQLFQLLTFGTLMLLVATQNAPDPNLCDSERCKSSATMFLRFMDEGMLPCDNFYEYMCRRFPKWNPIPTGTRRNSAFDIREEYVDKKLVELMNTGRDDSQVVQKVKTVYHNCMDEETIEELGSSAVPLELNSIGLPIKPPFNSALTESYDISRLLARLHKHASYAEFLFKPSVDVDLDDPAKNYIGLDSSPAGSQFGINEWSNQMEVFNIPSREASKDEEKMENEREYMKEVVRYMSATTYGRTSEKIMADRVQKVMEFTEKLRETKKLQKPEVDEVTKLTVVELQKKTDEILGGTKSEIKINWLDYLETLFANIRDNVRELFEKGEPILITNMEQFEAVLKVLVEVDQNVFVSSLWWNVVRSVAAFGSKELRRIHYDFEVKLRKRPMVPRQTRCLNSVKTFFPFVLGALLYFTDNQSEEDRKKASEMMSNIRDAFADTLAKSEWLDVGTKMAAINKLQYIRQMISYDNWMLLPSEIESMYADYNVFPGQYFTTVRLMRLTTRYKNFAYLTVDNDFASGMPSGKPGEVNAYYMSHTNGISIPIGILGPPFYGLGLEALNYGAIGAVMGHELGHAFDDSGKNYNTWGAKKIWWKKRTEAEYTGKTKCFIKTYNDIFLPAVGQAVNGKLTLNENLADYVGFTQALKAYRMYVQIHGQEKRLIHFESFSHEKLFTMAFANLYCENTTPDFTKWLMEDDVHSPGPARVLGVLRNSADFAEIWRCGARSAMNPTEKCTLW